MDRLNSRTVSVIGLGYIGLPTACLLATKGYQVYGCDTNQNVIEAISNSEPPFIEKDLDIFVKSAVNSKKFFLSTKPCATDIYILAVPTPLDLDCQPDMSFVKAATESIMALLKAGDLIILESTSPVGSTDNIYEQILQKRPDLCDDKCIFVAHCPERVLPGKIFHELVENDRVVGGVDEASTQIASEFYSTFVNGNIIPTDARTAELSKLVENAYRDVNIAFANELAKISSKLKINVWELINIANHHPRVNILQPGPGVGGHCIAVDPWLIVSSVPDAAKLIRTAREVNAVMPQHVISRVKEKAKLFKKPVIACLGLSYKENIDDLRESPAVIIVDKLAQENVGQLMVVEPHIAELPDKLLHYTNVYFTDIEAALMEADIILLMVSHQQFKLINYDRIASKVIIDTRGLWNETGIDKKRNDNGS